MLAPCQSSPGIIMLKTHSEPPRPPLSAYGAILFALGFRPFFAAAGLAAMLLIGLWLPLWSGQISGSFHYTPFIWHSHEMLFGFAGAIISGFLLTAVRNWTGVNTPNGTPLAALATLWLAGRIAPLAAGWLPAGLIAAVDLLFLPAVALALRPALWQGRQKVNRIFVPLLLLMGVANLLVHLEALGLAETALQGIELMLLLVVALVLLIGGRVIPFFTEAVIDGHRSRRFPKVEVLAVTALVALILIRLFYPQPAMTAAVALLAAAAQTLRLAGWHNRQVWHIPILWVLYSGFVWIIIGLIMLALAALGLFSINLAYHALTVGGIGVLTLGMMARVSLGHTGRPIDPPKVMTLAFILLNLAAVVRVFLPLLLPGYYPTWIHISGGLWILAFALFCRIYLPMLIRLRVDGAPG